MCVCVCVYGVDCAWSVKWFVLDPIACRMDTCITYT